MRLEKIKLSGFKSFVDPTTLNFVGNLVGVVGPNGSGKSNIVDAVRWVLGESSAKQLRGTALSDVIFNGSKNRKPVGQATIELIFDNSDGVIKGEYAQYNQISVRRALDRSGNSLYFLNGTHCRRRDIIDVFLGTGLGSYNYAIIEQGMISHLIDAKPDELREYVEEVAGISKYKERRRETGNRIAHTRTHLSRVKDLVGELDLQLQKLKRQARAAERYSTLREKERCLKGTLLARQWLMLDEEIGGLETTLHQEETTLEACYAEQHGFDAQMASHRTIQLEKQDQAQSVQAQYYQVGSEINRIEQSIQHKKSREEQLKVDLEMSERGLQEAQKHLTQDKAAVDKLNGEMTTLEPQMKHLQQQLKHADQQCIQAEKHIQIWQSEWDQVQQKINQTRQIVHLQEARIQHLEHQNLQYQKRLDNIASEKEQLKLDQTTTELNQLLQYLKETYTVLDKKTKQVSVLANKISKKRAGQAQCDLELQQFRMQLQQLTERQVSLKALQQAAFGEHTEGMVDWLAKQGLHNKPRLAQHLEVEAGWEEAVETVLGGYLEAIGVDDLSQQKEALSSFQKGRVTLFEYQTQPQKDKAQQTRMGVSLSTKVNSPWAIQTLFEGVYCESLNNALKQRTLLKPHESFITQEGLWIGPSWIRIARTGDEDQGVLSREKELRTLNTQIKQIQRKIVQAEHTWQTGQEELLSLEREREELQKELFELQSLSREAKAKENLIQVQVHQKQERYQHLNREETEITQTNEHIQSDLTAARELFTSTQLENKQQEEICQALQLQKEQYAVAFEHAKKQVQHVQEQKHQAELDFQFASAQLKTVMLSVERAQQQIIQIDTQKKQWKDVLAQEIVVLEPLQQELQRALNHRSEVEEVLNQAKQQLSESDAVFNQMTEQHRNAVVKAQTLSRELETKRLRAQEIQMNQNTLKNQLSELQLNFDELVAQHSEEMTEGEVVQSIEKTALQIERLGPINLAAIQECQELSQRKEYLDLQNKDLEEALKILQDAICKIDRETKLRFKEVFERLNTNFQILFPKVFGGGSAHLELTGDELLSAGVTLMAQPPGKQLRSIHLMSGGEKALTAIALIFSLFELNPAPFCILDEVDAPLDDMNVSRFCQLLQEMSQKVQLVVVSHNKNTVSIANHLLGVAMNEPGVSRIVAVNIAQALAMAEGE